MRLNKLYVLSIFLYTFSISCITIFFVLFFKSGQLYTNDWLIILGSCCLLLSILTSIIIEYTPGRKESMTGFEAWIERIDIIVNKHMKKSKTIIYDEDDEYIVSNLLVAFSVKANKNLTENEILEELNNIRLDLTENGIYIETNMLYKIYEEANDVTVDPYKKEITLFFKSLEKRRRIDNRDIRLEEIIGNEIRNELGNNGEILNQQPIINYYTDYIA